MKNTFMRILSCVLAIVMLMSTCCVLSFAEGGPAATIEYTENHSDPKTGEPCTCTTWVYEKSQVRTCTQPGMDSYKCQKCGKSLIQNYVAEIGHKDANGESAWVALAENDEAYVAEENVPATCAAAGKAQYRCSVCKIVETKTIEKLDHVWDESTKPDCTQKYCKTCEEWIPTGEHHKWNPIREASAFTNDDIEDGTKTTCTALGTIVYACEKCKQTKVLEVLNVAGDDKNQGHDLKLKEAVNWDSENNKYIDHSKDAYAACYYCTLCENYFNIVNGEVDLTSGMTEDAWKTDRDGLYRNKTEHTNAKGIEHTEAKAVTTCQADGNYESWKCDEFDNCGTYIYMNGDKKTTTEAGDLQIKGEDTYHKALHEPAKATWPLTVKNVMDSQKIVTIPKGTYLINDYKNDTPVTLMTYLKEYYAVVEPNCIRNGYYIVSCDKCDKYSKQIAFDNPNGSGFGHTPDENGIKCVVATCTTPDVYTYKCKDCEETITLDNDKLSFKTNKELGHDFRATNTNEDFGCYRNETTEINVTIACKRCQKIATEADSDTIKDQFKATSVEYDTESKMFKLEYKNGIQNHIYVNSNPRFSPKLNDDPDAAYADLLSYPDQEKLMINGTESSFEVKWFNGETSLDESPKSNRLGTYYAPTCIDYAYNMGVCRLCSKGTTDVVVAYDLETGVQRDEQKPNPLNHTNGVGDIYRRNYELILAPTCSAEGIAKVTCTACGAWYEYKLAKLEHELVAYTDGETETTSYFQGALDNGKVMPYYKVDESFSNKGVVCMYYPLKFEKTTDTSYVYQVNHYYTGWVEGNNGEFYFGNYKEIFVDKIDGKTRDECLAAYVLEHEDEFVKATIESDITYCTTKNTVKFKCVLCCTGENDYVTSNFKIAPRSDNAENKALYEIHNFGTVKGTMPEDVLAALTTAPNYKTMAATCASAAKYLATCCECGETFTVVYGDRLAHSYEDDEAQGAEYDPDLDMYVKPEGDKMVPSIRDDHKGTEISTEIPAKAPTCTEPGYDTYYECLVCKYSTKKMEKPALGHQDKDGNDHATTKFAATDATCLMPGFLECKKCYRPGCPNNGWIYSGDADLYVSNTDLATYAREDEYWLNLKDLDALYVGRPIDSDKEALGHKLDKFEFQIPDAVGDAVKVKVYCSNEGCEYYKGEYDTKAATKNGEPYDPDCKLVGFTAYKVEFDDYTIPETEIKIEKATYEFAADFKFNLSDDCEHTYGEQYGDDYIIPANCTSGRKFICTVCEAHIDDPNSQKVGHINAAGYVIGEECSTLYKYDKDGNVVTNEIGNPELIDGDTAEDRRTCVNCNLKFNLDEQHTNDTGKQVVYATCSTPGFEANYCSDCKVFFGIDPKSYVPAKGNDEGKDNTYCLVPEGDKIAANDYASTLEQYKGHIIGDPVAPTATTNGSMKIQCELCETVYTYVVNAAVSNLEISTEIVPYNYKNPENKATAIVNGGYALLNVYVKGKYMVSGGLFDFEIDELNTNGIIPEYAFELVKDESGYGVVVDSDFTDVEAGSPEGHIKISFSTFNFNEGYEAVSADGGILVASVLVKVNANAYSVDSNTVEYGFTAVEAGCDVSCLVDKQPTPCTIDFDDTYVYEEIYKLGDCTGNGGKVNSMDRDVLAQTIAAHMADEEGYYDSILDVNRDGLVDGNDWKFIKSYLVNSTIYDTIANYDPAN